jgi:hypothetical protein
MVDMPVIEAQCASILVPHDHRHINQKRIRFTGSEEPGKASDPGVLALGTGAFDEYDCIDQPAATSHGRGVDARLLLDWIGHE